MPIAINGTGTITGITAGGLPDGIITRSEIGYSGAILQVVQATTEDTANYASVNFQQTAVNVSITPASSTSKFLIRTILHGGVGGADVACSFNFYDSLNGATTAIAPNSVTGGDNNGSAGARMAAYFAYGCYVDAPTVDNWLVFQAIGEYLYTPSYQNTTARTIGVLVRTTYGNNFRLNMNGQNNTADPKDVRARSVITVMEVAA